MRTGVSNAPIYRVMAFEKGKYLLLQDTQYNTIELTKEEIKQAIKQGQLNVIDLQVSKDNRLVKKTVDLKSICVPHKGMNKDWSLPSLSVAQQEKILFYGLAYINSNMTDERKWRVCKEIKATGSMDADDLIKLFTHNRHFEIKYYWRLDTACRDKVIDLMYNLAK